MSKKKILIRSMIISLFLLCGICAYAYFNKIIDNTHNMSSDLNENSIIVVNNATEFYAAVKYYDETANDKYNSNGVISTKRKTIELAADITFYNDVLVTADCHINLNGHTIDLNGYNLTFKHQFEGVFEVYSNPLNILDEDENIISTGAIVDSLTDSTKNGKIIVDTPNAGVIFNEEIVDNIEVDVVSASATQIKHSAMNLVFSNIQNGNLNDFYTTIDSVEDFGTSHCFVSNHTSISCIYTVDDLDLIYIID